MWRTPVGLAAVLFVLFAWTPARAAKPLSADFDGDGHDDLAIGVPFKDYLGQGDSGVVHVLYNFGRQRFRFRPAPAEVDLWYQELMGLPGATEAGDQFGGALPLSRSGF